MNTTENPRWRYRIAANMHEWKVARANLFNLLRQVAEQKDTREQKAEREQIRRSFHKFIEGRELMRDERIVSHHDQIKGMDACPFRLPMPISLSLTSGTTSDARKAIDHLERLPAHMPSE